MAGYGRTSAFTIARLLDACKGARCSQNRTTYLHRALIWECSRTGSGLPCQASGCDVQHREPRRRLVEVLHEEIPRALPGSDLGSAADVECDARADEGQPRGPGLQDNRQRLSSVSGGIHDVLTRKAQGNTSEPQARQYPACTARVRGSRQSVAAHYLRGNVPTFSGSR
jgi:hypothetical protein